MATWIYNCVEDSIRNNELIKAMKGEEKYFFPNREFPQQHDYSAILYSGIYKVYEQDKTVKEQFETTLLLLINGTIEELLTAFDYIWRHKGCEHRGSAPFVLDKQIIDVLGIKIQNKKLQLKSYKESYEWGGELPEGAWEYIHNFMKMDL